MIKIQVPARVCLFGDHQDYLNLPVIAGAINRFIHIEAHEIKEREFQIQLKDLGQQRTISLTEWQKPKENDYFRAAMVILKNRGFDFGQGYSIAISGNVAINAGLSSSSTLTVSWIRFLIATQNDVTISNTEVGELAYQTEVKFFDQPGGLMDQYSIAQKGLLYIDTLTKKTEHLKGNPGLLVVAESGLEKKTSEVLRNARTFQEKAIDAIKDTHPDFDIKNTTEADYERYLHLVPSELQKHWYAAIYNYSITKKAKELLNDTNDHIATLAILMNQHQDILQNCIGNTPNEMIQMMEGAMKAGALATKIVGSGGGGTMLAMVTADSKQKIINAFVQHGAKAAYEVELVK